MFGYLGELIELRRDKPGEDMISDLIAGAGEDRLSSDEIKGMCALMLFAGHETTTSAIASAVLMLLEHPEQLQALRARPDELAASAVEEALRYEGPIKVLHRWVKSRLELGGREIREGERVLVLVAAANRDPERFPAPDRVDIARHPNPHIAFGRGIHACVGAQLARLEMRLAVTGIVIRLPGLRLARQCGRAALDAVARLPGARGASGLPRGAPVTPPGPRLTILDFGTMEMASGERRGFPGLPHSDGGRREHPRRHGLARALRSRSRRRRSRRTGSPSTCGRPTCRRTTWCPDSFGRPG